jgi:hypothetical protein
MHADLITKFNNYLNLLEKVEGPDPARNDLGAEALERLNQLAFIFAQLKGIDEQFATTIMLTQTNEHGQEEHYNATHERDEHLRFVMRLLTESYYYFAFRLRQLLRNSAHPFVGLALFESVGVRNVRNHLIEHPEGKSSKIFNRTFSWTKESGMHLKTGRQPWESSEFIDAGFAANSGEFNINLNAVLDSACEELAKRLSGEGGA